MKTTRTYTGWHFVTEDRRERFGDRRLIEAGQTYTVEPPIALCARGLHASKRALDVLAYAPGPIVCRVRLSGQIVLDTDKAVATKRTVLQMADATRTLHEFAIWCAEQSLLAERKAGREPDPRSWKAIEVKRLWLDGKATDRQLRAAWEAAWETAWEAAWAAAWRAAWVAAWEAQEEAAREAAWEAAWAKHNRKLEAMLRALLAADSAHV